jgi:hypothetical protein
VGAYVIGVISLKDRQDLLCTPSPKVTSQTWIAFGIVQNPQGIIKAVAIQHSQQGQRLIISRGFPKVLEKFCPAIVARCCCTDSVKCCHSHVVSPLDDLLYSESLCYAIAKSAAFSKT